MHSTFMLVNTAILKQRGNKIIAISNATVLLGIVSNYNLSGIAKHGDIIFPYLAWRFIAEQNSDCITMTFDRLNPILSVFNRVVSVAYMLEHSIPIYVIFVASYCLLFFFSF